MDLTKLMEQITAENNRSDMLSANKGTGGTNASYDSVHGNRGKQMNPNWQPNHRRPGAPDEEEGNDAGEVYGPVGSD